MNRSWATGDVAQLFSCLNHSLDEPGIHYMTEVTEKKRTTLYATCEREPLGPTHVGSSVTIGNYPIIEAFMWGFKLKMVPHSSKCHHRHGLIEIFYVL